MIELFEKIKEQEKLEVAKNLLDLGTASLKIFQKLLD